MALEQQGRHDLVEFRIQDNIRLEVYWRDDLAGYGPAVSIYAYDQEVLRLDCFGEGKRQKGEGALPYQPKADQSAAVELPSRICPGSHWASDARYAGESELLSADEC